MKNFVRSLFFLGALLCISQAAFAGGGPKAITKLPFTITEPGVYTLTRNLTLNTNDQNTNGIMITADDVTLDFGGYGIDSKDTTNGYGIMLGGHKRVEIKNGYITNFAGGIGEILANGADLRISNMRIFSNNGNAISLASNAIISGCTLSDNSGNGISIIKQGNVITGNVIHGNTSVGISVAGSSDILNNTVYSNGNNGIECGGGSVVRNNSVYSNTGYGIDASYCSLVDDNACKDNTGGSINWGSCDHTGYVNNIAP